MRHNLPMPIQQPAHRPIRQSAQQPVLEPVQQPVQRWRCPSVLRVESAVLAVIGVAIALVFFPLWFAIPVAVVLAAVYAGMAVVGASVAVDAGAGLLVFRVGLITRRVRLTEVTAVLVDKAKVSVARSARGEISLYVWGNSWLDRRLRAPAVATEIGHAIAGAVALAQNDRQDDAQDERQDDRNNDQNATQDAGTADRPPGRTRVGGSARARSGLAAALLGGVGVLAIVAALLVRVHWHNAVMTVLAVLLALVLGICGLIYLLVALWILLTRRTARVTGLPSGILDAA
jgi:hypothetical protein